MFEPNSSLVTCRRFYLLLAAAILSLLARNSSAAQPESSVAHPPYFDIVRKFADTLLENGLDTYGPKKTALWCGVINLENFTVPQDRKEAPTAKGFRSQDRAVGGCNLHQDVSTLHTFQTLSKITGDPRYSKAVNDYVRDYFSVAQNPKSGLLAWGEHMYYEVYGDTVHKDYGRTGMSHELVEYTPPWELLWEVDPKATARAIEGLKYHFFAEDPTTSGWLFNRHANWNGSFNSPGKSMPWIKHAALYSYSYSFLYTKTNNKIWKAREVSIGDLYWENRNTQTNLSPICLPVPLGMRGHLQTDMTSFPLFAYFLLKTSHKDSTYPEAREHALTMLKSFLHYSWDAETKSYRNMLNTDGTPYVELDPKLIKISEKNGPENPWSCSYGKSGLLRFGRIVAYVARTEKDGECLEAAKRITAILTKAPLPADFTAEEIGFGIQLNLDLFDLTSDKIYLTEADHLGRIAVERLSYNGMFRGFPESKIYEAKLGAGDLAAGLLRLSLRLDGKPDTSEIYDWSF